MIQGLRQGLRSEDPLDLLALVSGMLEVTDPRRDDPFSDEGPPLELDQLVDSFIGTPYAETTAALTVMRAMITDEELTERIGRELAVRRHPLPAWIAGLEEVRVEPEVLFLTHILGDGDDYAFGTTLSGGHQLTVLVYVDHNLGTVVKDAFVVPDSVDGVEQAMTERLTDADQTITSVDAATARAVIDRAIEHGAKIYPPPESDTWPMCRPIVEWLLRGLPDGGSVPQVKQWSEAETEALAEDFFASRFGAGLNGVEERDLLHSVLWFGTDYGPGDPLRWSQVSVEILLADWFPRKLVAEVQFLAKLPDLLRAFIRYAHDRTGIRASLTQDTLAAVDHWEDEYQQLIRNDRPQGPAALLAELLGEAPGPGGLGEESDFEDFEDFETGDFMLEALDGVVGGRKVLMALDAAPLPDEAFDWGAIPADIHPVVQEVLEACDRCADELLDGEHRTAMRRFLARTAAADPKIFRRKASPVRGAAAIAWVICRANESVGTSWSELSVQELLESFGVTGSVSRRAEPMLRANAVEPHGVYGMMHLGSAELLTAARRVDLIELRDYWLEQSG